jgi:hypothetical protein
MRMLRKSMLGIGLAIWPWRAVDIRMGSAFGSLQRLVQNPGFAIASRHRRESPTSKKRGGDSEGSRSRRVACEAGSIGLSPETSSGNAEKRRRVCLSPVTTRIVLARVRRDQLPRRIRTGHRERRVTGSGRRSRSGSRSLSDSRPDSRQAPAIASVSGLRAGFDDWSCGGDG